MPGLAHAQIQTWTGAVDGSVGTAGNWLSGTAPVAGGTMAFGATVATPLNSATTGFGSQSGPIGRIEFRNEGSYTVSLSGGVIFLGSGGLSSTRSGTVTIGNNIRTTTDNVWNIDTGATVSMSASLYNNTGSSGTANNFEKTGAGTLVLVGTAGDIGGAGKNFTITGGVVRIAGNGSLGSTSSTLVLNGGTLLSTADVTQTRPVSVTANSALGADATRTLTVSSTISGAGGVTKLGAGTLVLSGSNNYSGGTTLSEGILSVGAAENLGSSANALTFGGGTLRVTGTTLTGLGSRAVSFISGSNVGIDITGINNFTLAANLAQGSGGLTLSGSQGANSQLSLTGSNSGFTGTITVNSGKLNLGSTAGVGANAVSASNPLVINGSGMVSLGAVFQGGTATIGSLSSASASAIVNTLNGAGPGVRTLRVDQATDTTFAGRLQEDAGGQRFLGLTKTGIGRLTLSGINVHSGATTVSAGVLALGSATALSGSSAVTVNGGGLDMATFSGTVPSLAITSGSVFGTGTLTAATYGLGGGTVAANLGGGTLNVTGNSTLSGLAAATAVNLNAGTLTLGSGGRLTGNAAVSGSSGAALTLGGNETIASLAGIANVNLGSSLLTVGDATSTTYSGVLSGAGGSLTKTGAGRLLLAGANLYSGATTIAGGTLALDAGGSFANSFAIIVGGSGSSGTVLDLTAKTGSFDIGAGQTLGGGGTVQLASSGTLNVLGLLSPGNSPGLLTFDAGTTLLSGTTLMEISGLTRATGPSDGTGFYDAIDVDGGTLTFGGLLQLAFSQEFAENETFNLFSTLNGGSLAGNFSGVSVTGSFYNGLTWSQSGTKWTSTATTGGQSLEFNAATGTLAIVPEPGALALAGIGVAVAYVFRRRHRS